MINEQVYNIDNSKKVEIYTKTTNESESVYIE